MSETFRNMMNKENVEEYKSLKNEATEQIIKRDFYYARDILLQAYGLFKQDAEVCNMIGYCAYRISNLDESLKFYKLAHDLDSSIFQVNLNIGRIYLEKEKYSEAVYYFQEYMSEADKNNVKDNKAKVLRHLGYCYYYMNDFMNANY